jgi:hypothetical protein
MMVSVSKFRERDRCLSYRVSFINDIPRGGKLFHCCQRSIVIRTARNWERAVEAAKKRFARIEGIYNWNIHAGRIELEVIDLPKIRQSTGASDAGQRKQQ